MLSRRWRALLVALLTVQSVVALVGRADAQTGGVKITTDLELIGVGGLNGGGHLTWDLTGEPAQALRQKVLHLYDEYDATPRGFRYAGQMTRGNHDGRIDSAEAEMYTNHLENELEGAWPTCCTGTDFMFLNLDRADILEKGFPVERSTDGLVGTDPNSTAPLEIRFIFNARTLSQDLRFEFSDAVFANALHTGFDMRQAQAPNSTDPWPVVAEGGWHLVMMPDGQRALWHGNDSRATGTDPFLWRYDNGTTSAARTTTEPLVAEWTDLRFATWANATFRYMGRADSGDAFRLQVATGTFSTWTDLTYAPGQADLPDASGWTRVAYNLTAYAGQKVRLRLLFTSDASGNAAPGFFVRDFAINAPSRFVGTITSALTGYLVGTLDFQDFAMRNGRAHLIRTPAGEILVYGSAYNATAPPGDAMLFKGFDALENPQILFVVLVVTAYITSWSQDRAYEAYRKRHPERLRHKAVRIGWLRWVGRVLIILYIVFYFFPSLFVFFGASNAIVGGPAYWGFTIASTVATALAAWGLYARQGRYIPQEEPEEAMEPPEPLPGEGEEVPPPPPDVEPTPVRAITCAHCLNAITDPQDVYKCRCGQVYHVECADRIGRCPNCQRAFEGARLVEKKMVTANCPSCGEIQVVPEGADLLQTRCEACGALLKEIERGLNYLVIAPENDLALEWFHSIVKRGVPGLALSTTFQDKLRKEFGLEGVDLYWLTDTDTGPKSIDPKRLDFEMMRTLSNFIKRTNGGAVLLDGLEYLVVENSFDRVLRFIKQVTDLSSVHEVTLIIPVTAGSLGADELSLLRKEFDRVIETSGRATASTTPPPPPPEP